jgi:hypothetical protein
MSYAPFSLFSLLPLIIFYIVFFVGLCFIAKIIFRIDEIVKYLKSNKEQNDILIQQNDEIKNLLGRE